jgi:hypothetical protein
MRYGCPDAFWMPGCCVQVPDQARKRIPKLLYACILCHDTESHRETAVDIYSSAMVIPVQTWARMRWACLET